MGHFFGFALSFSFILFAVISSHTIIPSEETVDVRQQQRTSEPMSEMPPLNNVSSHVLDIARGTPAQGVKCTAYKWKEGEGGHAKHEDGQNDDTCCWELWGQTETNEQGRIAIVHPGKALSAGTFKLRFHTKEYFKAQKRNTFYPFIEVVFQIDDPTVHCHVPISLSNFGYSTYKGQ